MLLRASYFVFIVLGLGWTVGCGGSGKKRFEQTDGSVSAAPDLPADASLGTPPDSGATSDAAVRPGATTDGGLLNAFDATAVYPPPPVMNPAPVMNAPPGNLDAAMNTAQDAGADACASYGPGCPHPLAGRYAVRTLSYARQKSTISGQVIDLVSKGVLLSLADISAAGAVTEHLCFFELYSEQGIFSWVAPAAMEQIADSVVTLSAQDGFFVRPQAADRTAVSWSPARQPADCTPGTTHSSGCVCGQPDGLPASPNDCRVTDSDGDGKPGVKVSLGLERPLDLSMPDEAMSLQVAAMKAVEWRIPVAGGKPLVGKVDGTVEQSRLSADGEFASELGVITNANCPSEYGHVELVKGEFDCTDLLAERAEAPDSLGVFDASLDHATPELSICPDPSCSVDTDGDGTADCEDACPSDPQKRGAGVCGCGVADTNTDGDAAPDCTDECDADPAKTAAGACGCGVADANTDGDTAPDCTDECDADPAKTAAGACGCGVADANTDGDMAPDCTDECDADPAKTAAGACGCGVADANTDGDAAPDCTDECDADPTKVAAGACGCGVPDTDSDGDSQPDCREECDADPAKTVAGQCGCGVADVDLNGDGSIDCADGCPADPAKVAPGACGCGVPDTNTDGDSTPDCTDQCASDPAKVAPGACGCGVADANSDGDALPDCRDECDADATKTAAGQCGCGVPDTDSDADGTANCSDQCPSDPARTAPGQCGCGGVNCTTTLPGTYAVRSMSYAKQRIGSESPTTSKAVGYSLVTITGGADGSNLAISEQSCWVQTFPNTSEGGTAIYSWSKPEWLAALPTGFTALNPNGNGTYANTPVEGRIGWDPARQPATCSASATPASGWPSAWGATCRCNAPSTALPPYDRDDAPYDCRLTDPEQDGNPGVSALVSTSPPSSPSQDAAGLFSARVFTASAGSTQWTITPAADGKHSATIRDTFTSSVVGCVGGGCSALGATAPSGWTCPERFNKAQFIPATAGYDTCAEILAQRTTLFATNQDGDWPSNASCPQP